MKYAATRADTSVRPYSFPLPMAHLNALRSKPSLPAHKKVRADFSAREGLWDKDMSWVSNDKLMPINWISCAQILTLFQKFVNSEESQAMGSFVESEFSTKIFPSRTPAKALSPSRRVPLSTISATASSSMLCMQRRRGLAP